jgi:hypothetical protein
MRKAQQFRFRVSATREENVESYLMLSERMLSQVQSTFNYEQLHKYEKL